MLSCVGKKKPIKTFPELFNRNQTKKIKIEDRNIITFNMNAIYVYLVASVAKFQRILNSTYVIEEIHVQQLSLTSRMWES